MRRTLWSALALAAIGSAFAVYAAVNTTSLSMLAFAFIGVPAMGGAMLLYLGVVLNELRQKQVL